MKIRKILIRIGVGFLVFIAAVLAVRAVLNFTEGRALAKTLAGLKAQGIPLTAKDLAPPCADDDNGARLWKAYENMSVIPGRATADRKGRSDKNFGARDLIARVWLAFTEGQPVAPADRNAIKELVIKNAKALELLTEMGANPCFLYRDPASPLSGQMMPDAVLMIATTRLIFLSAHFSAEEGDLRGAVDTLLTGLKFTPLAAGEGTTLAFLISVATTRLLAEFLGDICRGRTVDDADLVALMAALDPGAWRKRLAASFRGERVFLIELSRDVLEAGLGEIGSVFEGAAWREKFGLWLVRPLLKRDARRMLPAFEFLEAQAELPYFQNREVLRAWDRRLEDRPWYAYLSKYMLGSREAIFMKTAQIEAIMLANRAGLACRLYKSRTGHYPETLDELVPGLLTEVPIDPFTGKPLVFRREGEGFIVYSLGSNEKDDGGRSTYAITRLVMPKDDDWSWREDR
jgi:hypothetical protein